MINTWFALRGGTAVVKHKSKGKLVFFIERMVVHLLVVETLNETEVNSFQSRLRTRRAYYTVINFD